ncbi:MAG TPA: prolyl oligopeptidase family serine peptidase [Candidatus Levybacteria bacterium]|nr:prolyl oligopeptidase family serine peptidase [Candidatus Levybacteria bacterium]
MKKKLTVLTSLIGIVVIAGFFYLQKNEKMVSPLEMLKPTPTPKPLLVYTFNNLRKTSFLKTQITMGRIIDETDDSISQMFYYKVPTRPSSQNVKTVSGLANIPKKPGEYPVIVMLRGFVPSELFFSGVGTQPSATQLVKNGYITLAPDFLGFGESDTFASDSFENRFQTYTTTLSLFSSIPTLNEGLSASYSGTITADTTKIGLWGHSNGGHIALSTLAISGAKYPTVLWAPVSKSFPYSILYYTDESDDQGKTLRWVLAQFEKAYDTYDFSPERYYQWIKAPILINQGGADQEVPYWWSDELMEDLKEKKVDAVATIYPGADHNMRPLEAWNQAVGATIEFYNTHLK